MSELDRTFGIDIPKICLPNPATDAAVPFFVHVHVPKSGGTSLNEFLERNLGDRFERHEGRLVHLRPEIDYRQVAAYLKIHEGMMGLTSHMFSVVLPYRFLTRRLIAISVLRDPVERFFSFYFHMRHRPHRDHPAKTLDLDAYIEWAQSKNSLGLEAYKKTLTKLENALPYIQQLVKAGNLVLVPTNELSDFSKTLSTTFPRYFPDPSIRHENVSERDQDVTDTMRLSVSTLVSSDDKALVSLARDWRSHFSLGLGTSTE